MGKSKHIGQAPKAGRPLGHQGIKSLTTRGKKDADSESTRREARKGRRISKTDTVWVLNESGPECPPGVGEREKDPEVWPKKKPHEKGIKVCPTRKSLTE